MTEWKAAGIVPLSIHNNKLWVLLGREAKGRAKGKYDAFGGSRENIDKTPKETALREGYEESMGFFGTKSDIRKKMKKLIPELETEYYIKLHYNHHHQKLFSDIYKYMLQSTNSVNNGFLEKDAIKWFPVKKTQSLNPFRGYFKKIYKYLVENHDNILSRL